MVRVVGLEPTRLRHTPLKRACLPIPAYSREQKILYTIIHKMSIHKEKKMKITRETDYAVRIVSYLSKVENIVGGKQISEETGITQRFALKILGKLCAEGILKSFKGNAGGYKLNKPSDTITMLEVIEAIEGKVSINYCTDDAFECCNGGGSCAMRNAFAKANEALVRELSAYTFNQL